MEKLDSKSLMIGDWVRFPIGNDKVCDLPYVEGKGICASFSASATLFPVPAEQLEPIPLTPEILERNGFVEDRINEGWWVNVNPKRAISIAFRGDKYGTDINISSYRSLPTFFDGHLFSVHELQHALRLCGIDLNIQI